ncbi:hypothetical protein Thermus72351_23690 [Thermus brockianus]
MKALRESKRSWEEIQELLGISRATYYRWERALREKGPSRDQDTGCARDQAQVPPPPAPAGKGAVET